VLLDTGVLISPLPIWIEDWLDPSHHNNPWLIHNIKREGLPI
jgi:uncharacterized protein